MIQQVMTNPGEIIFREVDVPEVGDDQVLVKIMNIGICGSDIHVYHGKHPFTKYPVTQGHEVSGEITELGKNVTGFKVGQKVTIEPQVYCGHCYPCRHGKYNLCEELKVMGFQTTGTASEFFAVDASKVTPIPEEMSYEEGAMIEPLAVAVHAVKQMGDVKGMNITVIGAGPIGNLVAQTAKGMGAAKVMITDVSDLRLAKAKECGIDICVNTKEKNFGEALVDAFGPDKADVIYDCAGNNITMGQAIQYARKGSVIVLVAVFADMATVDLAVANDHELDIKSTMMYRHDDYVDAIDLVNAGKVHLKPLISKTFKFKDYLKAYQYIDENRETMLMYSKEANNRKQEIDRQHHTIPNQRANDKHHGNVYNLLFRYGKVRSQNMEKLKSSFPTFCKRTFPQLHKIASYAHYAQCRLLRKPSHFIIYSRK